MPIEWPFPFGNTPISLRERFAPDFDREQRDILQMMARFAAEHLRMPHRIPPFVGG